MLPFRVSMNSETGASDIIVSSLQYGTYSRPLYDASRNNVITLIKYCRLSGSYAVHGMPETDVHASGPGCQGAFHARVAVPYFGYSFQPFGDLVILDHVQTIYRHFLLLQFMDFRQGQLYWCPGGCW